MSCLFPMEVQDPATKLLSRVRCGVCLPCRIRRKQAWVGRLRLERQCHRDARFVTLTYSQDPGVLDISDFQDFMKRYRYYYGKCRYFVCGEYGEKNGRGHWHALIFGHAPEVVGHWSCKAWDAGFAYDGNVTLASVGYVAGYTLKGGDDKNHKPIVRQSLKPGIGFQRIEHMARAAAKEGIDGWPHSYRINGRTYPLSDGALTCFKYHYLENGGLPPRDYSPLTRDLVARSSWLDQGTRIQQKARSYSSHRRENVDEFAAPKAKKSS